MRGLVQVVFATETLALGINMPARTVVLEKLVKYNGEAHVELTPGEYTQLTGRAGRRGIDVEGHAVVLWQPGIDPEQVAGLASTRTYPLRSSFRPGYNMAINLVAPARRGQGARPAGAVLRAVPGRSFGGRTLPTDRPQRRRPRRLRRADGLPSRRFHRVHGVAQEDRRPGEVVGAAELRGAAGRGGRVAGAAAQGRRDRGAGRAAVRAGRGRRSRRRSGWRPWSPRTGGPGGCRWPTSPARSSRWAGCGCPSRSNVRSPQSRRDLASSLRDTGIDVPARERHRSGAADDAELATLRRALRAHPCHGCEKREDHARWAERYYRLERRHRADPAEGRGDDALAGPRVRPDPAAAHRTRLPGRRRRPGHRARSPARSAVLRVGPAGRRVPSRGDLGRSRRGRVGRGGVRAGVRVAPGIAGRRARCRTARSRTRCSRPCGCGVRWRPTSVGTSSTAPANRMQVSPGRSSAGRAAKRWRRCCWPPRRNGQELGAGDFVRWCRQVVDLLDQIREVVGAGDPVGITAGRAVTAIRRGVVAMGMS